MNNRKLPDLYSDLRNEKGLSQTELANKLNCNKQLISKLESGERSLSMTMLKAYADFFNVSTDYLLGLTGIKTKDTELKTVSEYIGLNEEAAEKLHEIGMRNKLTANSDTLSALIEDVDFKYFLALLAAKMCADSSLTKTIDVGNARIEIKTSDLNDYEIEKTISEISSRMKDKFLKKYKTVDERQNYLFNQKMYGFAEGLLRENRITEQEYNQIIAEYDKGNFEYGLGRKV